MKPIQTFSATMQRVERLLNLYELLCNTRERGTRQDWAKNCKKLMHWPQSENIHRIDGKHAVVILREASGITPDEFRHDELSELLRAALVTTVSALDRYCHELLISRLMQQINRTDDTWSAELKKLSIPLSLVKKAIEQAKKNNGSKVEKRTRPMTTIKHALQDHFHVCLTLQRPDDISKAMSIIGMKDLWNKCANEMTMPSAAAKKQLNRIVSRRNQIVHEGDIKRVRKGSKPKLNEISHARVRKDVLFIQKLVDSLEKISK